MIIRTAADAPGEAELVTRRWIWPGPTDKPVYNFRSDGRALDHDRCLVPIDAFFEFTNAPTELGAGKRPPKNKWRFTMRGLDWFCVADSGERTRKVGEAWTMLTTAPGPDIAPYHNRQIALLKPEEWGAWLNPLVPATDLRKPLPPARSRSSRLGDSLTHKQSFDSVFSLPTRGRSFILPRTSRWAEPVSAGRFGVPPEQCLLSEQKIAKVIELL